jgi:hypothetical protein
MSRRVIRISGFSEFLIIPKPSHPTTIIAGNTIHAVVEPEDMPLHGLVLPTSKLLIH